MKIADMMADSTNRRAPKQGKMATTMASLQAEAERKKKAAALLVSSRAANPKTVLGY